MDIYNMERKYESALILLNSAKISERNKELILKFCEDLMIDGISKARIVKYLSSLKCLSEMLQKDFDKLKKEDVKHLVGLIQQKNYSPETKKCYKIIIKRFYKWIYQGENYPEVVSWIKTGISRSERNLPSEGDMLTEEDIQKILLAAEHPRNKAIIAMLWESGARVGEIANLLFKHVTFDEYGIKITVKGKTGSRKIRLIFSTPYVSTWINNHPYKNDPNAPLWINIGPKNNKKPISYASIRKLLQVISKKADIKKKHNPHLFRHSRATFLANYLTEFQMNEYFGWIQGSPMASTYVHMNGAQIDNALLALNGIKNEENKQSTNLQPRICPKCDTINQHDTKHCNKCGSIIDLKYALEVEEQKEKELNLRKDSDKLMDLLLKDKDVKALLLEKLGELGPINTI